MAKRTDIKKILIIGSGPIVIGQAAEFDYAGAQACRVLKDAGLVNFRKERQSIYYSLNINAFNEVISYIKRLKK